MGFESLMTVYAPGKIKISMKSSTNHNSHMNQALWHVDASLKHYINPSTNCKYNATVVNHSEAAEIIRGRSKRMVKMLDGNQMLNAHNQSVKEASY